MPLSGFLTLCAIRTASHREMPFFAANSRSRLILSAIKRQVPGRSQPLGQDLQGSGLLAGNTTCDRHDFKISNGLAAAKKWGHGVRWAMIHALSFFGKQARERATAALARRSAPDPYLRPELSRSHIPRPLGMLLDSRCDSLDGFEFKIADAAHG